MTNLNFCPNCGTKLVSGDVFCPSCGLRLELKPEPLQNPATWTSGDPTRPVTPIPDVWIGSLPEKSASPIPPTQPLPEEPLIEPMSSLDATPMLVRNANPPKPSIIPKFLMMGIVVVVFLGGWYWWYNKTSVEKPQLPLNSDQKPQLAPAPEASKGFQLADFDGVWRAYWANSSQQQDIRIGNPDDDLFIEVRGSELKIYPRSNTSGGADLETTCSSLVGHEITCETWEKTSPDTKYRLKLVLSDDKTDLQITELPDMPTEPVILKCKRVSVADGPPDERLVDPSAYEVPDAPVPIDQSYFPPVRNPLSEKQAIDRVRLIPEVKEWLGLLQSKGAKAFIEVNHMDKGKYIIRCYEVITNENIGHTATQGWYSVDKTTGFVDFYLP